MYIQINYIIYYFEWGDFLKIQWKKLIFCIVLPLAVGGLAGLLTRSSMETFQSINKPAAVSSRMAVSGSMDDLIHSYGDCFISCSYIREAESSCFSRLRNTACFQLFLAYHFLQSWGLFVFFYLVGCPMDSYYYNNDSVFQNIQTCGISATTVSAMGYLCRIS